jgi:Fe-S cluster assembly protein SufD
MMKQTTTSHPALQTLWQEKYTADHGWFASQRKTAFSMFQRLGFPNRKQEAWRYTDIRALEKNYPEWLANHAQPRDATPDQRVQLEHEIRVVFVDQQFRADLSDKLPEGVVAGTAAALTDELAALADHHRSDFSPEHESGLIALNAAFTDSVIAIRIADGVRLDRPLHLQFIGATPESVVLPRVYIALGKGASATVLENFVSNEARIVNSVTEIYCGENSQLKYYNLQEESAKGWHTAAQYANVASRATITTAHIDLGASLARNELNIRLSGEHAQAYCNGVFIADADSHSDCRINVEHLAPHTTSRERFRGVLADRSRGVFNGRIYVGKQAQKTLAELSNRNLLLSAGAEINTKPELEIYADDVKCAHGSTTGQLDQQSLFYLLSRGIDREAARSILILAFASELVTELDFESLADRVRARISQVSGAPA